MDKLTQSLNDLIRREKLTSYRVAKGIGIDYSSFHRALNKEGNLGSKTVDKILDLLGYEVRFVKSKGKEVKPRKTKPSQSRRRKENL